MSELRQDCPLSASQRAGLENYPDHSDTRVPSARSMICSSVYTDQARFDLEMNRIFLRYPVPVAPSALLPTPGMFVGHQAYGVPILLTRGKDSRIRAFRNVCQHRGTLLCEDLEAKAGGRVVCPYHAWTYGLEGQLIGVPQESSFAAFDKSEHHLQSLPCREVGGVIWVGLQSSANNFSDADALSEEFAPFGLEAMFLYRRKTWEVDANWKLIMDAFLEGYHVTKLHADSVGKFFVDVPTRVDPVGLHIRTIQGRANFDKGLAAPTFENVRRMTVFGYNIFPSAVLITSPTYINFMVVMPRATNRSTVEYSMLVPSEPTTEKEVERYRQSFALIDRVFGNEDFRAAALGQKGLESGGLKQLLLGGLEQAIRLSHDHIESRLQA